MSYLQANPFVTNIVPLFNVTSAASGPVAATDFTVPIQNLQSLLDYNTQTLSINNINPYDTFTNAITINGDLSILGQLSINGTPLGPTSTGTNSFTGTSFTISTGTTGLFMIDTQNTALGSNTNAFQFYANNIPSFRIDSNGNSFFNTITAQTNNAQRNNSVEIFSEQIFQKSDQRNVSNISVLSNALNRIKQIEGFQYSTMGSYSFGIIAQQISSILPPAVDIGTWSIDYSKLFPLIIQSIKELSAQVNTLSTIVALR